MTNCIFLTQTYVLNGFRQRLVAQHINIRSFFSRMVADQTALKGHLGKITLFGITYLVKYIHLYINWWTNKESTFLINNSGLDACPAVWRTKVLQV